MILFRSSGAGNLMTNAKGVGITDKQFITLNSLAAKETLTLAQDIQFKTLQGKKDAPFVLSDTAKSFVKQNWLWNEKGYKKDIKNKYIRKGLYAEEESISLLSRVTGTFYTKNEERRKNDFIEGECDLNGDNVVLDTKTSWDLSTFMNAELDPLYEWQLRCYMELWDVDNAVLAYCLVDAPEAMVLNECQRLHFEFNSINPDYGDNDELWDLYTKECDQIRKNLIISDRVPEEDRVKLYTIKRDKVLINHLYDRISHARDYYNTLTLNQI